MRPSSGGYVNMKPKALPRVSPDDIEAARAIAGAPTPIIERGRAFDPKHQRWYKDGYAPFQLSTLYNWKPVFGGVSFDEAGAMSTVAELTDAYSEAAAYYEQSRVDALAQARADALLAEQAAKEQAREDALYEDALREDALYAAGHNRAATCKMCGGSH